MVTHGPIFASFSRPSTNSDMTLKIIQLLAPLISAQSLSLKAFRIFSSSNNASCDISLETSFVLLFFLDFIIFTFGKRIYKDGTKSKLLQDFVRICIHHYFDSMPSRYGWQRRYR